MTPIITAFRWNYIQSRWLKLYASGTLTNKWEQFKVWLMLWGNWSERGEWFREEDHYSQGSLGRALKNGHPTETWNMKSHAAQQEEKKTARIQGSSPLCGRTTNTRHSFPERCSAEQRNRLSPGCAAHLFWALHSGNHKWVSKCVEHPTESPKGPFWSSQEKSLMD